MANLKCKIVLRSQQKYFPATGVSDPPGTYFLRFYQGAKMRHQRVGPDFRDAEIALLRKERELDAASRGYALLPEETPDVKKSNRIVDVIEAYLADLKESRRAPGAISVKKSELMQFAGICKKVYVEQITRGDLIAYRNHLIDSGLKSKTVLNKLMIVTTWLKKNPVVSVTGLLKGGYMKGGGDWPDDPETIPQPYSDAEQKALLDAAGEHRLMVWFYLATGMRRQEVQHTEVEDIEDNYIKVQAKPKWGWSPKTCAGTRQIPLGKKLLAALKASRKTGLLFPNGAGNPSSVHILIVQEIAERAGVPNAILHRFRDTFATRMVQSGELDLREVAKRMGHHNLDTMRLYADYVDLNSAPSRRAAKLSDRLAPKKTRKAKLVVLPRLKLVVNG
jgi:site-specific recombinase XerD